MNTLTLIDFLLARIAEDEAEARATSCVEYRVVAKTAGHANSITRHAQRWQPERVLAECEAKRRTVEMYVGPTEDDEGNLYAIGGYGEAWVDAIKFLALPYADHSDYREEWKP